MDGSVTIVRAGSYELSITIDGTDVIGSPLEYLKIRPDVISAPECVAVDVPTEMYAGFDYSF